MTTVRTKSTINNNSSSIDRKKQKMKGIKCDQRMVKKKMKKKQR